MEEKEIALMLAKLEIRAKLTRRHVELTNDVLDFWRTAQDCHEKWVTIYWKICVIIKYLSDNSTQFPNYRDHMDQWVTLRAVAMSRGNME